MIPADLPEPTHDPSEVRELTDEILERPEYNPSESITELISRKVGEFFDWLFGGFEGPGAASGGGGTLGWLAWLVLIVMIVGVAAFVGWAVATGRLRGPVRRRGRSPGDDGVVVGVDDQHPPARWLNEAEAHEAAGRWRQGILCRYRALVLELAGRGIVSEVAGRTSGELAREVAAREVAAPVPTSGGAPNLSLREGFSQATDMFEEVWYGGADSRSTERDRFAELATSVLSGSSEGAEMARRRGTEVAV